MPFIKVTSTIRDGFSAVSFLLPIYAEMLKNGLNSDFLKIIKR